MKYYHVIYNSSEKGIDGGRGFCFRTYTKGTPANYLTALQDNDLLNYSQGECEQLMPKTLKDDPDKIKTFPTSYFFRKLAVDGKNIYVLGRTIPVGFDYTFYIKYAAGRMGNYVTDCYIFEENPGAEVIQMLYEKPAQGSNHFIPVDPAPKEGNEEMKALSLGQQEALPEESKPFNTDKLAPISDTAIKALFSLIEAKKNKKALVIRTEWKNASSIIADMYRMLPNDIVGNYGFVTNYQEEGLPKDTPIISTNEYYMYSFSDNMAIKYNTTEAWTETAEYATFGEALRKDLDNGDMMAVHNRVKWLLSDAYYAVKDKSKETNTAFYQYCIVPEEFSLSTIDKNEEFTTLLADHIKRNEKNKEPFMSLVDNKLKSASSAKDASNVIDYVEWLNKKGFDVKSLGEHYKTHITTLMTSSASDLSTAISMTDGGLSVISKYFDKSILEKNNKFLDETVLSGKWVDLYKFFYKTEQLEGNNRKSILERMINVNLKKEDILTVLGEIYSEKESIEVADLLKEEIFSNPDKVKMYWPLLVEYMEKHGQDDACTNLVDVYKQQLANEEFAPLFFYQYKKKGLSESPEKALVILKNQAESNAKLKSLFETEFKTAVFNNLLAEIKEIVKENDIRSAEFAETIKTNVIEFYSKSVTAEWSTVYNYLHGEEKIVSQKNIDEYLNLAKEIDSKVLFEKMLLQFVYSADKCDNTTIEKFVTIMKEVGEMNIDAQLAIVHESSKRLKNSQNFFIEILKQNQIDIKTAEKYIEDKTIDVDNADNFLTNTYGDKYKTYKRKNFIKNLLKKPFFWVAISVTVLLICAVLFYIFFMNTSSPTGE